MRVKVADSLGTANGEFPSELVNLAYAYDLAALRVTQGIVWISNFMRHGKQG